jgi:glucoamylase
MPLLWAHAEFLKLLIARERGRPIEWLERTERHFGHRAIGRLGQGRGAEESRAGAAVWHWRDEVPAARLPHGKSLAIEDRNPFTLHLGFDGWQRLEDRRATRTPFGLWSVVISQQELAQGRELNFTRHHESGWEGIDYRIELGSDSAVTLPEVRADSPVRDAA